MNEQERNLIVYELWEYHSANRLGEYDREDAALAAVRAQPDYERWETVGLIRRTGDHEDTHALIAEGRELVDRAIAAADAAERGQG